MGWRDWTGFGPRSWEVPEGVEVQPSKTLWDVLQLLIVPVILVGVTLAWSASQDSRDKRRAAQERQDATLNDYIKQMSDLMLTKRLLSSGPRPAVPVARTLTVTTLHRLDAERNGEILRFLREAGLLGTTREDSHSLMIGADLRNVDFQGADLEDANLRRANLDHAHLRGAGLAGARLVDADLENADLRGAHLETADLYAANLRHADLRDANLRLADLSGAHLEHADLRHAHLEDAGLEGAYLEGAIGD